MQLYKIIAIALIAHAISITAAAAQSAVGKTTRLMHPSGIPALVTTNTDSTISNVDGRIVNKADDTGLRAHQAAVKELQWSGFQLQAPDTQDRQ